MRGLKKHFQVFCLLTDREVETLSKRFSQERLQSYLASKLDLVIQKECDQIEMDEEFIPYSEKTEKL